MPSQQPSASEIEYTIRRQSRKHNITITVSLDGKVIVSGPKWATDRDFATAVQVKREWILHKLSEFAAKRSQIPKRKLQNGETVPYLGRSIEIVREVDRKLRSLRIELMQGKLLIREPADAADSMTHDRLVMALERFYVGCGKSFIPDRVALYAPMLRVHPNRVTVKNQKRRWGSCNPSNRNLNFNWRLMMTPLWVLDYVVVHELAHLVHANHSKAFWATVEEIYPAWREAKEWLHANGLTLTFGDVP
jgi:predicted metal-dependent hydrolase